MDQAISNYVGTQGQHASTGFPSHSTYVPFTDESTADSTIGTGNAFAREPILTAPRETPFHRDFMLVNSPDSSFASDSNVPMLDPQHSNIVFEDTGTVPLDPAPRRSPANENHRPMLPEPSVFAFSQAAGSVSQGYQNHRQSTQAPAPRTQSSTSEATAPRTATSRVGMKYRRHRADKLAEAQQNLDRLARENDELRQRLTALTSEVRVYRELLSMGRRNGAEMFTI